MILVDAHEREKNLKSLTKEMNQKDLLLGLQALCQILILGLAMFPLRTPISIRKSLILQAPVFRHADLGLSGCNPASTKECQVACAKANTHVQKINRIT